MDHTRVQRISNRWYKHTVEVQVPIGTGRLHSVQVTWEVAVNRPQYCFQRVLALEAWAGGLRPHTAQRLGGKVMCRPVLLDPTETTFWAYTGEVLLALLTPTLSPSSSASPLYGGTPFTVKQQNATYFS